MKLIVGLGNPGKKYDSTWHNAGFMALSELQQMLNFPTFKKSIKFKGELTKGEVNSETIILLRPLTYMNLSGSSVRILAKYYKVKNQDLIVIHDDLDLPLGKLRLAKDSSAGGHNGIKSIIEELSGKNFDRIKIGIKTSGLEKIAAADYVLMKADKAQLPLLLDQTKTAAEAAVFATNERMKPIIQQASYRL